MTLQEIQDLAGHRDVPPWVVKLVGDAVAREREACAKSIEKSRVIEMVVFPNDYLISRNDVQKCYDHQHKQCVEAIRRRQA